MNFQFQSRVLSIIGRWLFQLLFFLNKVSIKGEDNLSMYQFNTMIAKHFFCKICGIYTHHYRRSDPNGAGVNIGCIDEIDPFEYDSEFIDMKNK